MERKKKEQHLNERQKRGREDEVEEGATAEVRKACRRSRRRKRIKGRGPSQPAIQRTRE